MKSKNYLPITFLMMTLMSPSWSQIPSADLDVSESEALTMVEQYQSEAHHRLNEYEKLMDVFYVKLSKENQKVQIKNKEKLQNLEKKSAKLRIHIESYKSGNDKEWSTFKLTTTRAIDAFGAEIEDLKIEI